MHSVVFHTIVVGDNGTRESERAVDVALSLAHKLDAKVLVVGVLAPPSAESQAEGYGLDSAEKARKILGDRFSRLEDEGRRENLRIVTEILAGDPEKTLERRAQEQSADLIVVGHREVGAWRRWLEGSTTEGLLHHLNISLLVVR